MSGVGQEWLPTCNPKFKYSHAITHDATTLKGPRPTAWCSRAAEIFNFRLIRLNRQKFHIISIRLELITVNLIYIFLVLLFGITCMKIKKVVPCIYLDKQSWKNSYLPMFNASLVLSIFFLAYYCSNSRIDKYFTTIWYQCKCISLRLVLNSWIVD